MAGTTANLALPYPTGGDPVVQGDDKIKALAEAVDASIVGTSANLAFSANWTDSGNSKAERRGRMVGVHLAATRTGNTAWTGGTAIATVPAGYRPLRDTYVAVAVTGSGAPAMVLITAATGVISAVIAQAAGSAGYLGDITYPI